MKFVNYGVGLHTLNDTIDARSQINTPSLSNAPPYAFRPPSFLGLLGPSVRNAPV